MPAAISKKLNLAFFSIPKSASTSMKMALWEIETGQPWTDDPDKVHPRFRTFPITPDDFKATEGMRRITIVRDPVRRLLSAYGNRVHHHGDIRKSLGRPIRRIKLTLKHPWVRRYPSANSFYSRLSGYQALSYSIWHHTCSIRNFIGDDLSVFDRVYRVEDLAELEADLSEMAGRAIHLPHEQTGGMKLRMEDLSPRARAAVLASTAEDYALLKGLYTPPV